MSEQRQPDGTIERHYDTHDDGRPDYAEVLSTDGMVKAIRYGVGNVSEPGPVVVLNDIPESERRDLVILLDSIPFGMVRDLWNQGRFRLFGRPCRVISPFPVMTDVCFNDFFGLSPSHSIEAEYFDGEQLVGGVSDYLGLGNSAWLAKVDYHMDFRAHGFTYLDPAPWLSHELRNVQDLREETHAPLAIGYCVGTSAVGALNGRNGHQEALVRLDRFCQSLVHQSRGRVRITLLSDHGHNLVHSKRISLSDSLARMGYRVGDRLTGPQDVVVPEFGMVTYAAVHTRSPAAVARDLVGLEGVELTLYRDTDDCVVVLSRDGQARIKRVGNGYAYRCEFGDPLQLLPVLPTISQAGSRTVDQIEGFFPDDELFVSTANHIYPDALHRCWRAFHGLIEHPPDVLVSIQDGYHCGSAGLSNLYDLAAAHGSLNALSSSGFALTMKGALPEVVRMENLRSVLQLYRSTSELQSTEPMD